MNEENFSWTISRSSFIAAITLVALNVIAVIVGIIFASNTPSEDSKNILTAIMQGVDLAVFWVAFALLVIGGLLSIHTTLRVYVRFAITWLVALDLIAVFGWWVLGFIG